MNTLAYKQTGNSRWQRLMPTFLVDGQDLVSMLLGDRELKVAGVGVSGLNPNTLLFPGTYVYHRVHRWTTSRQCVLDVDLGDCCGGFVSANVKRSRDTITWSQFETYEGVRTPLLPAGPFVFSLKQYVEVLAPLCLRDVREVQRYWAFPDGVLRTTWAWEWPELSDQIEKFPKPEGIVKNRNFVALTLGMQLRLLWWHLRS
jgi:hypothetical protein